MKINIDMDVIICNNINILGINLVGENKMNSKYEVGVDVTFGTYIKVEASDAEEAKLLAEQIANRSIEYPRLDRTVAHYVGTKAHTVHEEN
jgi:hypothetical protein